MKEIGIEKLIELLNEYEKEIKKSEFYEWEKGIGGDTNLFRRDTRDEEGSHLYSDTADTYVISKQYGFIKWLVENEKIEGEKFQEPKTRGIIGLISNWHNSEGKSYKDYSKELAYESLLMLLAIQDEPIRFLCEILK